MKKYKYQLRKCKSCKTEFRPLKENQPYCSKKCGMIKKNCKQCGKEFGYPWNRKVERIYCSRECSGKSDRIGTKLIKCINCDSDVEVYHHNTTKKYCNRKCKDEYQSILFAGENNPNFGNSILKGIPRSPEVVEKIRFGVKTSWQKESRLEKYYNVINSYKDKFGFYPMHAPKVRVKAAESYRKGVASGTIKQVTHGKCGKYTSIKTGIIEHYDSSWEEIRMLELDLDDTVKYWTKKHKICIKLEERKWYIPDFLIEYLDGNKVLEEVKGYIRNQELFELKSQKAIEYVNQNNISEYKVNFMNHLRRK